MDPNHVIHWSLYSARRRLMCIQRTVPNGSECAVLYEGLPIATHVASSRRGPQGVGAEDTALVGVGGLAERGSSRLDCLKRRGSPASGEGVSRAWMIATIPARLSLRATAISNTL